jgi:hypothetical protein
VRRPPAPPAGEVRAAAESAAAPAGKPDAPEAEAES